MDLFDDHPSDHFGSALFYLCIYAGRIVSFRLAKLHGALAPIVRLHLAVDRRQSNVYPERKPSKS
jgi:hypothetical protein